MVEETALRDGNRDYSESLSVNLLKITISDNFAEFGADLGILKAKIRQIFRIVAIKGRTHIVLGAFVCGAFNNPPKRVAQAFRDILAEEEWDGRFEEVIFAVLDTQNEGNFRIFRDTLGRRRHTEQLVRGPLRKFMLRGRQVTHSGAMPAWKD